MARFNAVSLVCESIHVSTMAHWASSHAVSFLIVIAGIAASASASKSSHYIMAIVWELILLPTAAWLELSNSNIRHLLHVPTQHRYAIILMPIAVALRGLDPLSFKVAPFLTLPAHCTLACLMRDHADYATVEASEDET